LPISGFFHSDNQSSGHSLSMLFGDAYTDGHIGACSAALATKRWVGRCLGRWNFAIEKEKASASNAERRARSPFAITDPQPVSEVSRFWRTAAQAATIGMFLILLVVALSLGRPILLPVASAFVVSMMLGPLSARAERYRVPSLVSALALWLLVIAVFYGVIVLLAGPALDWIGKAPDIGRNIQEKLHILDRPIAALQDLRDALLPSDKEGQPRRRHYELRAAGGSHCDAGNRTDAHFLRHAIFHAARTLSIASRPRRIL
jgi:hypothetical protein